MNNHMYSFLTYLESLKYSVKTIEIRKNALNKFRKFTDKDYKDITEKDIREFLSNSKLSINSQNTYLLSLRQFFTYLEKDFVIFSNPARNILCIKNKKLPEVLSEEQIQKLFQVLEENSSSESLRHKAVFELFYSSGLRQSELLNIKLQDLDLSNQTVLILGKGNKERVVPFGDSAKKAISQYITSCRPKSSSEYLFLTSDGQHLTKGALNGAINYIKALSGIDFSSHTLRRTCATHLLNNGASPMMIAELLGHQSLKTLSHYLKVSVRELKIMHKDSRLG